MSKKEKTKTEKVDETSVEEETKTAETANASEQNEKSEQTEEAAKADSEDKTTESGSEDHIDSPKKKDPKDAIIEELQDRNKRQMAEFDNFRKRSEKEKSMMFEMGASDILKKLLPIVDNFERGFKAISDEEKETPFAKGMDMVLKQTLKMLEDSEVKPIEAVGIEFNPDLHNAVMHVDDESVGENVIVEEFEKGYTYRDTVIRHSMVKVAN